MNSRPNMYDLVVIGAGASGLFSAVLAARKGLAVLVLEKNSRPGKKLALCGGGNCNIGPREQDIDDLMPRYAVLGSTKKQSMVQKLTFRKGKNLWYQIPPAQVLETFSDLGIAIRYQDGQLFPAEYDAPGFRDELERLATEAGARILLNRHVTSLEWKTEGLDTACWHIACGAQDSFLGQHCFLACGGSAYPTIGGTDQGNEILASLGVATHQGEPAMGGLHLRPTMTIKGGLKGPGGAQSSRKSLPLAELSGLVIPARVQVWNAGLDTLLCNQPPEQLLFTHRGLSGPAILDICGLIHESSKGLDLENAPVLVVDFCPDQNWKSLDDASSMLLVRAKEMPKKQLLSLVSELVPRALAAAIIDVASLDPAMVLGNMTRVSISDIAALLWSAVLKPRLPTPWAEAMSWTGGCDPGELDMSTMEVSAKPGLYVLGDMVSLDRPCGGYSLWFAWTSAMAAVKDISKKS